MTTRNQRRWDKNHHHHAPARVGINWTIFYLGLLAAMGIVALVWVFEFAGAVDASALAGR